MQCQNGRCACPPGQTDCGGTCKNLNTDSDNCGTCGMQCTTPYQKCQGGQCVCDASSGFKNCDGTCIPTSAVCCGDGDGSCGSSTPVCCPAAEGLPAGCCFAGTTCCGAECCRAGEVCSDDGCVPVA